MSKMSNIERFEELKRLKRLEIELHRENIKYILKNNSITESSKFEGIKSGLEAVVHGTRFYFSVFRNSKTNPEKDFDFAKFGLDRFLSRFNFTRIFSSLFDKND